MNPLSSRGVLKIDTMRARVFLCFLLHLALAFWPSFSKILFYCREKPYRYFHRRFVCKGYVSACLAVAIFVQPGKKRLPETMARIEREPTSIWSTIRRSSLPTISSLPRSSHCLGICERNLWAHRPWFFSVAGNSASIGVFFMKFL